jgi:putative acetyltransferase
LRRNIKGAETPNQHGYTNHLNQWNRRLNIMSESGPSISRSNPLPAAHPGAPIDSSDVNSTLSAIEIRALAPGDDATAFRTLNEEWITRYFTLEAKDREILDDPVHSILLKGGYIFMAYVGAEAIGCVALIPMQDGVYELSKMAVSPHLRGIGIGRRLLQHAITQARSVGAKSLFLGSNTRLKNAVHLYESVGFRHVKPEALPPMPYSRADVFMEMPLGWDAHGHRHRGAISCGEETRIYATRKWSPR